MNTQHSLNVPRYSNKNTKTAALGLPQLTQATKKNEILSPFKILAAQQQS